MRAYYKNDTRPGKPAVMLRWTVTPDEIIFHGLWHRFVINRKDVSNEAVTGLAHAQHVAITCGKIHHDIQFVSRRSFRQFQADIKRADRATSNGGGSVPTSGNGMCSLSLSYDEVNRLDWALYYAQSVAPNQAYEFQQLRGKLWQSR